VSDPINLQIGGEIAFSPENEPVVITELLNPEKYVTQYLGEYLKYCGFASQYPNFRSIRIGSAHPLIRLAFSMLEDQPVNVELFPSITVVFADESEGAVMLGRNQSSILWSEADFIKVENLRNQGALYISDANLARVHAALVQSHQIMGIQYLTTWEGMLTLDIWSENRDITLVLYDLVKGFLPLYKDRLSQLGFAIGAIRGSGAVNVNMEFGKILYGAAVSTSISAQGYTCMLQLPLVTIEHVQANLDGQAVEGQA